MMGLKIIKALFLLVAVIALTDAGTWYNRPGTVYVHENYDWEKTVWSNINAYCYILTTCVRYTCTYYQTWTGWNNWQLTWKCRYKAVYYYCYKDKKCNSCSITSNSMFKMSGLNVVKKACTDFGCGPTCSASYCLNNGDTHTVGVGCKATGYYTDGYHTTTFKVKATDNSAPSIWLHSGTSVSVNKNTHSTNSYVNRIRYSDPDASGNNDFIRYYVQDDSKFIAWDYSTRTDKLFYLNTGNGYLYVNKDLSSEYSYTYTGIKLCIADRRDSGICATLTITVYACYEIPSCRNQQKYDFSDTHGIGSTLFTMSYPNPSMHFPNFNSNWAQLQWTLVGSDLNVATVDYYGGVLKTSSNITVWPSYPYRDYYATIRVGNSESCGRTTTCTMNFRVYFTNHAIQFVSLPNSITIHENYDPEFLVHLILAYDGNNPAHDNVTCSMPSFSPSESNMFQLRHDGNYKYNSWSIYRLACQQPACEDDCPKNKGCFTYGTTANNRFVIDIQCWDAYGSTVSSTFTLNLQDNTPPSFTAANEAVVYINKNTHNNGDTVTTVYVSNSDSYIDNDYIRYWVVDDTKFIAWDYPNVTRTDRLFSLNTATGVVSVAEDLSMEYSYTFEGITICIRDRRDTNICRSLTIVLTACYEIPTCYDQEKLDFWDTHPEGNELFQMKYPDAVFHFPNFRSNWKELTWTLVDSDLDVATVDYSGGILRTSGNITVWPSYPYRDYFAIIRVENSESCGRTTTCEMTFRVWFKNWPIRFISLPNEIYRHENEDNPQPGGVPEHLIITYDYNNPAHDNVTCTLVSISPSENNIFELVHDGGYKHNLFQSNHDSVRVVRKDCVQWTTFTFRPQGGRGARSAFYQTVSLQASQSLPASQSLIHRRPCQKPKCEYHCEKNIGCFTYDTTQDNKYVITIKCDDAYDSSVQSDFTVNLIRNSPPEFTDQNEPVVYINKDTHSLGSFVTRVFAVDSDLWVDDDYIRYNVTDDAKFIPWDYPNVTRTDRLFELDEATGDLFVAQDLSMEYSFIFEDIEICIADRRDAWICRDLTIVMTACYEIPACYDQEYLDFWDTHAVGDTLFDMKYPDPVYHFPVDFTPDWLQLTWTMDDTDLDVAELDFHAGILRTFANITVWPSWRYRDYFAIIRVENSESCGRTTTCVMTFRIWFKNWPIRFVDLPREMTKCEDDNDPFDIYFMTYDYNYHLHDNVTCDMSFIPYEPNLFTLEHDGNYDYNSWSIHRHACTEPTCGFHCDKGIGCFTYNTTLNQEFRLTVTCWDAYDTDVTAEIVIHLDYNKAPRFNNLPNIITLDHKSVSAHDLLYSIGYADWEDEDMHLNFTFSPNNGIYNGILIFECDTFGNYYDNRANITSTVYYHSMPTSIYYIYICGTERRNMICETLTVQIKDSCPAHPTCEGGYKTVEDTTAIGTLLFNINGQQDAASDGTLSYSFISPTPAYFQVNQESGAITVAKSLVATYPSKTYQLTAFVYDSAACNYGSCQFSVTSTFTNYPIVIENQPYQYLDLPEDTEINEQLVVIVTSDQNPDDTVTCTLVQITSDQTTDPISQDLFRVRETSPNSNVYYIENRELPNFTSAITIYLISFECHDKYGPSAFATLTVMIKTNEYPTFTNLNDATAIEVDPSTVGDGAVIYRVSTSDEENDPLTFSFADEDPYNPLALSEDGRVYLRRDVSIIDEDGIIYAIEICIRDLTHTLQPAICGRLNVTFVSSQKYPVLSNLPANVTFSEDAAGGTTLYDVDVDDENLDSVHTFSMAVDPPEAASMFSLHTPTGILTLQPAANFDYEERQIYTFLFAVKDQYLTALEKKELTVNIDNVNESPSITIVQETVSFDEDTVPGTILSKSLASCSDVDNGDTHTFSIENSTYSTFFSIDATTSRLSLAQEWDLEALLPKSAQLNIVCTDAGGLTSSKLIGISVAPVNEIDPVIVPTSMMVAVDSNTTVVENLGEITSATDDDIDDDGVFLYTIVGVGQGKKYFTMTQTGILRLRTEITLQNDRVFKFSIAVSDEDYTPRARTATCLVTANYTAPTEAQPEEPTYCITCTTWGKVAISALVIEGLILCTLIAHCLHHIYQVKALNAAKATINTNNMTNIGQTSAAVNTVNVRHAANVGQNPVNRPTQPLPRQQQPNLQQNNARSNEDDRRPSLSSNDEEDDESLSDDSDIDERLRSNPSNQTFQPRNQPFPTGIDAATVGGFPSFGSGNYA